MNTARVPWRPLLALTAAVVGAHLWLLRGAPETHHMHQRTGHPTFVTRTIVMVPPPAIQASLPATLTATPARAAVRAIPVAKPHAAVRSIPVAVVEPAIEPLPTIATVSAQVQLLPTVAEATTIAVAVTIPAPVRLHYSVTAQSRGQHWQARSELNWRHDGISYEAKLEVSAPLLPTRTQRSTGAITADGLAPLRFSDKGRSEEAAHFEREKGKVSFSSNRPDVALLAGAQDRLSVLLQLGAMIAGAPRKYQPAATIAIQTAGTRDAEPWHFTVEGQEQLQLPGGAMKALKLTRHPRKEFDQKVELWLSPSMDYAPVRLRLTQPSGDWVDQQWSSTDRS